MIRNSCVADTETVNPIETLTDKEENVIIIPIPKKARKKSTGWTKPRYVLSIMEGGVKVNKGTFCTFKQIGDWLSAFNPVEYDGMKPAVCKYIYSTEKRKRYRNIMIEKYTQPAPEPVIAVNELPINNEN